ncbi:MAG: DUF3575 domain-containing protein [Muribaculaceae bacterium]|nr:DUF3575 domain-containing protein [Muribaculaceae bacterium]
MDFRKFAFIVFGCLLILFPLKGRGEELEEFRTVAPQTESSHQGLLIKSNLLPWALTIPNLGLEYIINEKWSATVDVMFCPWKLTDKFSVKTVAVLPEGRWWLKSSQKGSFFNLHLNLAWFNVRANDYRYQDVSRPLLGAGIGYGYRLALNKRWCFEFEIGAGMANAKYDRYYNVENGALKDTRVSTYWGIDRASIAVTYYICDL